MTQGNRPQGNGRGELYANRYLVLLVAVSGAAVIGVSRLLLGVHSLPEVILGGAVGVAGALALAWLAGPPPPRLRARRLTPVIVAVLVLFHGERLPAEAHIHFMAISLARQLRFAACPRLESGRSDQARPYVSSRRTISSSPR